MDFNFTQGTFESREDLGVIVVVVKIVFLNQVDFFGYKDLVNCVHLH